MKKLMFTLAIVSVAFTSVQAQKQLGGEHNVEVSFNPFADNPIDASVIKYRKFLDDDAAIRVSLSLNNSNNSYLVVPAETMRPNDISAPTNNPDLFLHNTVSNWSLSVGYEKHFNGMDALSPYVAVQAGYGSNNFGLEREHYGATGRADVGTYNFAGVGDVWVADFNTENWQKWSYSNDITSNSLNLDLLFGADYYFSDAIYVGFEAGLRYNRISNFQSTITASNDIAFNLFFDGQDLTGQITDPLTGSAIAGAWGGFEAPYPEVDDLVTQQTDASGNLTFIIDNEVNFVINGAPDTEGWEGAATAVDALWSDWDAQSPADNDRPSDPKSAYESGSSFFRTYSTGMLRIGFLID
jgi:hypothetical protein